MLMVLLWLSPARLSSTRPAVIALCTGAKFGNVFQASCDITQDLRPRLLKHSMDALQEVMISTMS
jgi:hypothetical protein